MSGDIKPLAATAASLSKWRMMRVAVDGVGERLAHFELSQNRVGEIDADVLKRRALMGA